MIEHLRAMAEGQFSDVIDRDAVANIEVAVSVPRTCIPPVGGVAGVGLELFWRVVEAVGVSVGSLQAQPLQQAALEACLEAVVIAVSDGVGVLNFAKSGI